MCRQTTAALSASHVALHMPRHCLAARSFSCVLLMPIIRYTMLHSHMGLGAVSLFPTPLTATLAFSLNELVNSFTLKEKKNMID